MATRCGTRFAAISRCIQFGNHTGENNVEVANVERDNNPGSADQGFWFRGTQNTFDGNEAWNNAIG